MSENDLITADVDPDALAVTLLAALQGGLLIAQVYRDIEPLQTTLDTLLRLAGITDRDGAAEPGPAKL